MGDRVSSEAKKPSRNSGSAGSDDADLLALADVDGEMNASVEDDKSDNANTAAEARVSW